MSLRIFRTYATGAAAIASTLTAPAGVLGPQCRRLTDVHVHFDIAPVTAGNLTITPSGGIAYLTGNLEPATDDTYYLGRNDDDTPKAWKAVILKDTTNGKYYRVEVISGVLIATDLTD